MTRQPKARKTGSPKRRRGTTGTVDKLGAGIELPPEQAREILEERARRLARASEVAQRREAKLVVVTFTLANERYAIEAHHLREVVRFVDFAAVPDTPDFVVGVANLRGAILAVVDLGKFFGLDRQGLTELSRMLVLGEDRAEFGVLADQTHGLEEIDLGDVHEPAGKVAGIGRDFVKGTVGEALVILDGAALLNDQRLFIDQQAVSGV